MAYSREPGQIGWIDLTVGNADETRAFYERVAGWRSQPFDLGDRIDFNMFPLGSDEPVTGICNAVGEIADLPPVWLMYINVTDLDAALSEVSALGGSIVAGPKGEKDQGRFAVVRDPAGAAVALFEV